MALTEREQNRRAFVKLLEDNAITTARAADLLHSSRERIATWLRPEAQAGSCPVPIWALELLQFKIDALKLGAAKQRGKTA